MEAIDVQEWSSGRKFSRIPIRLQVQLRSYLLRAPDVASDLCEGGIRIETPYPVEPYCLVSLRIELPTSARPINMLGRVMWASATDMGVSFLYEDPSLAAYLDRLRGDFGLS